MRYVRQISGEPICGFEEPEFPRWSLPCSWSKEFVRHDDSEKGELLSGVFGKP